VVTEAVNGVAVGLGAALFLVNPFAGLAGAGATMLYNGYRRRQHRMEQSERERYLQETVQRWREEMIQTFVWQKLHARLRELNRNVVAQAAEQYALRRADWPLPLKELRALQQQCRVLRDHLALVGR
jgi:hypothetical protein